MKEPKELLIDTAHCEHGTETISDLRKRLVDWSTRTAHGDSPPSAQWMLGVALQLCDAARILREQRDTAMHMATTFRDNADRAMVNAEKSINSITSFAEALLTNSRNRH